MERDADSVSNELLEAWKQTIQVQQHFNDIELKIRNYAITLLGALFGVAAYAFKEHVQNGMILGLLFGGLLLCYAFYFMDRHWYHSLLVGAVKHGLLIEKNGPAELKLTSAIGDESPVKLWGRVLRSNQKIAIFYLLIAAAIVVMAVGLFLSGSGSTPDASVRTIWCETLSGRIRLL